MTNKQEQLLRAAEAMDWQQVILNQGQPCFHLQGDGRFCGRAERWEGHGASHKFTSLADLLEPCSKSKGTQKAQRFYDALRRISSYLPPESVRRDSEHMGLGESEAVEMAYENVIAEAKRAVKGMRRPK